MGDAVAGLLLVLDVLLLATVVTLLLRLVVRAVLRYRRRDRTREYVVRRCDNCHLAWQGEPDVDYSRLELLLKRAERRRARTRARHPRPWAKARGWNRCPSCLSTRVRTSGDGQRTEEENPRLALEVVGQLATMLGAVLLLLAALGLAARS